MLARGPGARLLGTAALRRGLAVAGTAIGGLAAAIGSAVLGRAAGAVVQGGAALGLGQAQTDHGSAHRLAHARPSSL